MNTTETVTDVSSSLVNDLITAIDQRNITLVKKLIDEGVDINTTDCSVPPLVHAAQMEPVHLFNMDQEGSLELPVDGIPELDRMSDSVIEMHPISDMMTFLLSLDVIDVNIQGKDGKMPLHVAVENSMVGTVKVLLEKGADVNRRDEPSKRTPLHYAVRQERHALVPLLLRYGAIVNAEDERGRTPLYMAVANSEILPDVVQLLINDGARVDVVDSITHNTLLHLAVEAGYDKTDLANALKIVNMLLMSGAPFLANGFCLNPIHSCFKWKTFSCMAELVRHGADILSLLTEFDNSVTICEVILKRVQCLSVVNKFTSWSEVKRLFDVMDGDGFFLKTDSWLAQQKVIDSDTNFLQLMVYVLKLRDQPVSLKNIARHSVRDCLKRNSCEKSILPAIQMLEIPYTLKDYLALRC